jgi:hypothetical protein
VGIAYSCHRTTGLSVSVWNGEVTAEQRQRHMALLASDPEWGAGGLLLTDLTGVSAATVPAPERVLEAASIFIEQLASRTRNAKWAIVADATFDHAQRFGAYLEEEVRRVIVFNHLTTACTWLGVDAPDVREIVDALHTEIQSTAVA